MNNVINCFIENETGIDTLAIFDDVDTDFNKENFTAEVHDDIQNFLKSKKDDSPPVTADYTANVC